MKREFQIRFLKGAGLAPEHYLLDIGCGTLRGGLPLIEYLEDGHYYGLEARSQVLEEGRRELAEARLEAKRPVLVHAPALKQVVLERQFDFIWAFSVLIHLSDDLLEDCLALAARHLGHGGSFHANVNLGEREEARWQGFPVVYRSEEFYRSAGERHGLEVRALGNLKSHGHRSGKSADEVQFMLRFARR